MGFFSKLFGKKDVQNGKIKKGLLPYLNLTDADKIKFKNLDERIVVGKVLEVVAHPDAQITKVRMAKVSVDSGKALQILCGGKNLAIGQIVPVATVDARLSEDFTISVRAIRGVESFGMICSRDELGLSKAGEKEGEIWAMPKEVEKFLGRSVRELI